MADVIINKTAEEVKQFLENWDFDATREIYKSDASLMTKPSTVYLGNTFGLSNAVMAIGFYLADGTKAIGLVNRFNEEEGSISNPRFFALGTPTTLSVMTLTNEVVPDGHTLSYTTFGDNLTTNFSFIPNTAGKFRVEYWLGSDATGAKIFDDFREVTQAEVDAGQPVKFGVGSHYLLTKGTQIFVRFSGIELKGSTAPAGHPFEGTLLPYFISNIIPFKQIQLNGHVEFFSESIDPIYIGCTYAAIFTGATVVKKETVAISKIISACYYDGLVYYVCSNGDIFSQNPDDKSTASPVILPQRGITNPTGIYVDSEGIWLCDSTNNAVERHSGGVRNLTKTMASGSGGAVVNVGKLTDGSLVSYHNDGVLILRDAAGNTVSGWEYVPNLPANKKVRSVTTYPALNLAYAYVHDTNLTETDYSTDYIENVNLNNNAFNTQSSTMKYSGDGMFYNLDTTTLFVANSDAPYDFVVPSTYIETLRLTAPIKFTDSFTIVDVEGKCSGTSQLLVDFTAHNQGVVAITQKNTNLTFCYKQDDGWYIIDNNDGYHNGRV